MDWLRESMEKKTLLPYNQFALGCFTGFDITLSGIQDPKEKEELIELIKKNGGNYSGTFDSENTTHVITKVGSI